MIASLQVTDPKNTCIPWWEKVSWLKDKTSIEFKPGLNILWGPNGSGKSTLLLALSRMLHCEHGGTSTITETSLRTIFKFDGNDAMKNGAVPVHDGQAVTSYAAGAAPEIQDDSFSLQSLVSRLNPGSRGETIMRNMAPALEAMKNKKPLYPEWRVAKSSCNLLWRERLELVETVMKGTIPLGAPTILLDEPEQSIGVPAQGNFWDYVAGRRGVQIIVATHSPFALRLPKTHYIDIYPGYMAQCEQAVRMLLERGF